MSAKLNDILVGQVKYLCGSDLPFSFFYGGTHSSTFLDSWKNKVIKDDVDNIRVVYYENRAEGGLEIHVCVKLFGDYAIGQEFTVKNGGKSDTALISAFRVLDFTVSSPDRSGLCLLHRTNGGYASFDDYIQNDISLSDGENYLMKTNGGRSSDRDLPFFTVDRGTDRIMCAIGWTGAWMCNISNRNGSLHADGGIESLNFKMYPGETFYLGSSLILIRRDNIEDSYSDFRKIIASRFIPRLDGRGNEPYLFCNTCFTRGGGWLNECNEENQINLINALKPLHTESVITDAGWFEGGWPWGAGNWNPNPEKYPNGFTPVTSAAAANNMKYGLWFEPERVIAGTDASRKPELLLRCNPDVPVVENETMLLNYGNPDAVDYMYRIIEDKITNDGIRCYRQDFNVSSPAQIWRVNETTERIGICEIKYINGLYNYLDRIRTNHPDVFMDGCASGGNRIDLETIKRFHTHQKTDLWFQPSVDQNSLFSLSHYMPCTAFTAHINCYSDYNFDSVMAATLCLGWIADNETETYGDIEPFCFDRAMKLIDRYEAVRPYLNADFYPLYGSAGQSSVALAWEYFDAGSDSGVIFIFTRGISEKGSITVHPLKIKEGINYNTCFLSGSIVGGNLHKGFSFYCNEMRSYVIIFSRE